MDYKKGLKMAKKGSIGLKGKEADDGKH